MKLNGIKSLVVSTAFCIYALSNTANAGLIEFGNLTLENAGDIYVTDTVTGIDYLRWDQVRGMNYAQLTDAVAAGGSHEGWSIARNKEANDFTNALLPGTSTCEEVDVGSDTFNRCTLGDPFDFEKFQALIGGSLYAPDVFTEAFFLNDNGTGAEVGSMIGTNRRGGEFQKLNDWSSIGFANLYSSTGQYSNHLVGFALYRGTATANPVPEPSSLAIFALGIIGLASRRFKK